MMKRTPVILLLSNLLFVSLTFAQTWIRQPTGATNDLSGVSFIDADNGIAVGAAGTIIRTTDSGKSWNIQSSTSSQYLTAVSFADYNLAVIAGFNGTILRSTDGGNVWNQKSSSTTNDLFSAAFVDANTGYIAGASGTILKTTDGGLTWKKLYSGTTESLFSISFSDAEHGIAVGNNGVILRTTDGGQSWSQLSSGTNQHLSGAAYVDNNNCIIAGYNGTILRTTNAGQTWSKQTSGTYNNLLSVSFINTDAGYIVGNQGTILKTTDGGQNWALQSGGTTFNLSGVSYIDAANCTAVGIGGMILRSKITVFRLTMPNGGEIWPASSKQTITWKVTDATFINLEYSATGTSPWTVIEKYVPAKNSSYLWTVPAHLTSSARIRITDSDKLNTSDTSDNDFTIALIRIDSPQEDTVWHSGSQGKITWKSTGVSSVNIEYSTSGSAPWKNIALSIPASQENYLWTVPSDATVSGKIRISDATGQTVYDLSDSSFVIDFSVKLKGYLAESKEPSYVNMVMNVTNTKDKAIMDLSPELVSFTDDEQTLPVSESRFQIAKKDKIKHSLKAALLIDNSTSLTAEDLVEIKKAATALVRNKMPGQEIALYSFSESFSILQDYTADTTLIIDKINSIKTGLPTTNLYGSLIKALERWQDTVSVNELNQGILIVFTDGEDTQGSSSLSEVLLKKGNKRVYAVGFGSYISLYTLSKIGSAGAFYTIKASELTAKFLEIQKDFENYANSFYYLNYISPKRQETTEHRIEVFVRSSNNASLPFTYSSKDFYSLVFGIAVNPDSTNPYGADTLSLIPNAKDTVVIRSPFVFGGINYQFTSQPDILKVTKLPNALNDETFEISATDLSVSRAILKINDLSNNYKKDLVVKLNDQTGIMQKAETPIDYKLYPNFPNPFNMSTTIKYALPVKSDVEFRIYSITGKEVASFTLTSQSAGYHSFLWNGKNLKNEDVSSGIFLLRMRAVSGSGKEFCRYLKLIMIK